mmetsp:Transcript_17055/g.27723  ORF Transcript_17055/g.27723 Transcript_17055/m.27723 type:complete len:91 (+) Transcript_17055:1281-1553(+)
MRTCRPRYVAGIDDNDDDDDDDDDDGCQDRGRSRDAATGVINNANRLAAKVQSTRGLIVEQPIRDIIVAILMRGPNSSNNALKTSSTWTF